MAPLGTLDEHHYDDAPRFLREYNAFRSNSTAAHESEDQEIHEYSQIVTIATMVIILFIILGFFFLCILLDFQSRNEDDTWSPASDGCTVACNHDGKCPSCREALEKQEQGLQD